MILQRNSEDLGILADNLNMLQKVVPDKNLLEHIFLDLVLYDRNNFVVDLPFDLKENAAKTKSAGQLHLFFSRLELVLDAAERTRMISKIENKKITPYKLDVKKCKKGFSYVLHYFDGRLKSREYTQEEIWNHPRFMRY